MTPFDDLFSTYNGQQDVGNTVENKGECVGLVAVYVDSLGLPHIWGDACDLFVNADETFFDKILNTPDAIPQEGDIIVWPLKFNGTAGHTGIATKNCTIDSLECFEQNDPLGSNPHIKVYTGSAYLMVTGWLRPKISSMGCNPTIISQSDAFITLCTKLGSVATKDAAVAKINGMQEEIKTLEDNSQALDRANKTLLGELGTLKEQLSTAMDNNKTLQANYTASQGVLEQDRLKMEEYDKKIVELEAKATGQIISPFQHILMGLKGLFGIK